MTLFRKFLRFAVIAGLAMAPGGAHAAWGIVDQLNLSPFVPMVLDALMTIATGGYEFFVGNGDGIIYMLVWGFLGITMVGYLVKMYMPKTWLSFFGISGGGEMWTGKAKPMEIAQNMLKPALRGIIAAAFLLQIQPTYITRWLVNPFLQFGAMYTHSITETINEAGIGTEKIQCPQAILDKGWISPASCEFLVQPVSDLSRANNQGIKRGFEFIDRGLRGLITLIPHGGEDFLNLITGIILVATFFASNLFMALLIIQAIFNFGMALILYPFQVLSYVAKSSDKWLDVWPAFAGITKALQQLVITMIACAFILCVNMAVIRALFQWNSSVFVVAAGGATSTNMPQMANSAMGFGQHSILWLSAILTFYLMFRIFDLTRQQLLAYTGDKLDTLHKQVIGDAKATVDIAQRLKKQIGTVAGWIKK